MSTCILVARRSTGMALALAALAHGAAPAMADDEPTTTPASTIKVRPLGYLRVQGAFVQDDPNVAFVGRADGFELQYARAGVDVDLGTHTTARLSIDAAVDERDRVNEPNGTLRVGVRDAYADVHAPHAVDVRAGQFEPVFDSEEFVGAPSRAFVDTALPSRGVRATEGFQTAGLSPGRSVGIALRRDPGVPAQGIAVGFELAAQNGAGDLASNNDNDWVAASVAGIVRTAGGGWIIVGGRINPRSAGELPLRQDETDFQGSVGAMLPLGPLWLGGGGIVQRTTYPTSGGDAEQSFGAHAQLTGGLLQRGGVTLSAGYRFAIFDPSDLVLSDRMMEHTAGIIAAWPAYHLRLLGNVTHAVEQRARNLDNDRIEAVIEVTL